MSLFDPVAPSTLFKPHLPSTLGLTNAVKVVPDLSNSRLFKITWTTIPSAVRYVVFASPCPTNKNKFTDVPPTQTSVDFEVPIVVPDDYIFYFWVAFINPQANTVFLQDEPVFTTNNSAFDKTALSFATERDIMFDPDDKYRIEEMRRRNLALMEFDGEDFLLHMRRLAGQPCVCLTTAVANGGRVVPMATTSYEDLGTNFDPFATTPEETSEAKDPEYQAPYRCPFCFGVGIAGGYFPSIQVRARYGNIPRRELTANEQGIQFEHRFNSWTIWHPRLKEGDFLIRKRSGERFLITEAGQSEWRGMPMHQEFTAIATPRTAAVYDVTNDAIVEALQKESAWDVAKWNWAIWS